MAIHFDFDMLVFSWSTLKVVFGAKSRLRRNARPIPKHFQAEIVAEDQLTPAQRKYLEPIDAQLLAINYRPICTFRVTNYGTNLLRRYGNPSDPASCALTVVEVKVDVDGVKGVKNSHSVEFGSRFAEGKRLSTRNSPNKSIFDQPPYRTVQEFPNTTSLADLKRKHDAGAREMGVPSAPPQDGPSVLQEFQAEHERYSQYQLQCGNYRMGSDGNSYILGDRVYDRGIRNHFLPFGKRISITQVIFSALVGAVLPLFGILKIAPWLQGVPTANTSVAFPVSWVAVAACYVIAGITIGAFCDVQKFAWIMIITYLPTHLVAGWTFGLLPYSTFTFLAAYFVAQAMRRRSLVLQT